MARKRLKSSRALSVSPLNPAIHFILFLALAFVLVVIVSALMKQASDNARAALLCPQTAVNQTNVVEELSARCPNGVQFTKDNNGCGVWVCKTTPRVTLPSPKASGK